MSVIGLEEALKCCCEPKILAHIISARDIYGNFLVGSALMSVLMIAGCIQLHFKGCKSVLNPGRGVGCRSLN